MLRRLRPQEAGCRGGEENAYRDGRVVRREGSGHEGQFDGRNGAGGGEEDVMFTVFCVLGGGEERWGLHINGFHAEL